MAYIGSALHHAKLYDKIRKSEQKIKVQGLLKYKLLTKRKTGDTRGPLLPQSGKTRRGGNSYGRRYPNS